MHLESPESLDIVELNPAVLRAAPSSMPTIGPRGSSRALARHRRSSMAAPYRSRLRRHHPRADATQLRRRQLALLRAVLSARGRAPRPRRRRRPVVTVSSPLGPRRPRDHVLVSLRLRRLASLDRPALPYGLLVGRPGSRPARSHLLARALTHRDRSRLHAARSRTASRSQVSPSPPTAAATSSPTTISCSRTVPSGIAPTRSPIGC